HASPSTLFPYTTLFRSIFDLTENNALIYGSIPDTTNYIITYHNTLLDAENDTAAIGTANAYDGTDGEVMYARLDYLGSDCFDTRSEEHTSELQSRENLV